MMPTDLGPLANHLWQSTLFVIAVWLLTLVLRKNRAAVRHRLWVAASLKFLVPFSMLAGVGSYFQSSSPSFTPPPSVAIVMETISLPFTAPNLSQLPMAATSVVEPTRIPTMLLSLWLTGFVLSLVWWTRRWWRVHRAVRQGTPENLDLPIRTLSCNGRLEPGVFGIFKPVLLLPRGITECLSTAQLQAVIAHEMTHVRRRDNLTAAIHMFVEALFWFHPLVWWIRVRMIDEQERACDEEVLRRGGDPQVYAESILKICEFYVTSPLMCVSGITGSDLKKRIEVIMRNPVGLRLSFSRVVLLTTTTVLAVVGPVVAGIVSTIEDPPAPASAMVQLPAPAPQIALAPVAAQQVRPVPVNPPKRLEFEAVSLKVNPTGPRTRILCRGVDGVFSSSGPTGRMVQPLNAGTVPQGRCVGAGIRIADIISTAYGLPFSWRIANNDDWPLIADLYQLEAKAENATTATREDLQKMLQTLLVDRLKLKVHRGTQEAQGYALVVAKDGSRLKEATGVEGYLEASSQASESRSLHGNFRMQTLAELMTDYIGGGTAVVDRTGLPALYEVHLVLNRVGGSGGVRTPEGPEPGTNLGVFDPPLFKAMEQQLGLRLESRKISVDTVVIDHIEKPSEN
jgi:uncharacterized protein (TIGR03435 family)